MRQAAYTITFAFPDAGPLDRDALESNVRFMMTKPFETTLHRDIGVPPDAIEVTPGPTEREINRLQRIVGTLARLTPYKTGHDDDPKDAIDPNGDDAMEALNALIADARDIEETQ